MKRNLICLIFILMVCQCSFNKNISKLPIESNFSTAMEKIASDLKNSYLLNNSQIRKKLAVLVFVNENGNQSRLGEFLSNNMQQRLFDPKTFILLERERIDSLLSEYEFNQSGLVNNLDSKKLGQLIGADLVLVGTISLNKTNQNELYFAISGRIVNLDSGEINAVSSINIISNDELFEKYNTKYFRNIKTTAGTYKVVVKDIIIENKKANGRQWDAMSGPDVYVTIKTTLSAPINSDIYSEKYELPGEVLSTNVILGKNDYINISVFDYDEMEIDTIGNLIIGENQIIDCINNNKQIETTFDQVKHIIIIIEKLEQ